MHLASNKNCSEHPKIHNIKPIKYSQKYFGAAENIHLLIDKNNK